MDKKLWSLIVNWPWLTFSPIQIFRSTVQLTGQKCDSRLETWYEQSYGSKMVYESHMKHSWSKNPCANSNPNLRLSVQGDVLSWANPNPVWSSKSLVRGNLAKMRVKILRYNRTYTKCWSFENVSSLEDVLKVFFWKCRWLFLKIERMFVLKWSK